MVKRAAICLVVLCLLLGCNTVTRLITPSTPTPAFDPAATEYAVYSALIEGMFSISQLDVVVIEDHTGLGVSSADAQQLAYLKESLPEVDQAMLDDFQARNAQAEPLAGRFTFKVKVKLISQDEVKQFFDPGGGAWDEFYKRYPNSQGIMTLSKVGFNVAGDRALVYVGNQSHFLAGTGYAVVLARKGGVWTILNQIMLWIS